MNPIARTLCTTLGAAALLVPVATGAHAATISAEAWGADPSTNGQVDWSGGNATFTHAVNFRGPDITYDADDGYGLSGSETMTFYGAAGKTFSGAGGSGTLDTRSSRAHDSTSNPGDFTIDDDTGTAAITRGFRYNGPTTASNDASLVLTGLTANTQYELVLYQASTFTGNPSNLAFVNTGTGSSGGDTLNNISRGGSKVSVLYTTGINTTVTLTTDPQESGSWHWYAFSNQVVPEPSSLALLSLGGLLIARRRRS
jgi:hypothetical protein